MVTVVMTTYNPAPDAPRFDYAYRSMQSLRQFLLCEEPIDLLVSDDGSPDIRGLRRVQEDWRRGTSGLVSGSHNGIGASLNRSLSTVIGPWMYTTDDWVLTARLDLDLPLWLLTQGYDLVRLGPMHPDVKCTTNFRAGHGWWLDIDVWSAQYACGTRPFLAAPSLLAKVGPFTEGVDSYAAEIDFCAACQMNDVVAASVNIHGPWETIGDDYPVGALPVTPFPFGKGGEA